jgi:hypothetical protein
VQLKTAIERRDSESRVFFAPTDLRAGGSWTAQLAQEIKDATAFILLVGERGLGPWQVLEYDEALDKRVKLPDFPLIVVLLEGQTAPGLPFLRGLHCIITPDPASEKDVTRLFNAASGVGTSPGDLWRYTSPYRGLEAMEEKDSDYFFGRERETVDVLEALAKPDRMPVLIGNSGVGKSSLAKAGVLAALKRQAWPDGAGASNAWPRVFRNSRQWCFLTLRPGTQPVSSLVDAFLETWQLDRTGIEWPTRRAEWVDGLVADRLKLHDLLDQTKHRHAELQRSEPPAFLLYVDQGEELYVRAEERQRRRFSELLVEALSEPRLRTMMSLRSDFLGSLQSYKPLFSACQQINVLPLGEQELHEVVSRPAALLGARFETDRVIDIIAQRAAEDSIKDVGALPLLSYTLDDMWTRMMKARSRDGVLRLPAESFQLGGVLVERANVFLAEHPVDENKLRRILTLKLATVREDGKPTKRRASRAEFTDPEWRLVSDLADHPYRLLVTTTTEAGETYAEVAHESIFLHWQKLREWIVAEQDFLSWRRLFEDHRKIWESEDHKDGALLMGLHLTKAKKWANERANDLSDADREFIRLSLALGEKEEARRLRAERLHQEEKALEKEVVQTIAGWLDGLKRAINWPP